MNDTMNHPEGQGGYARKVIDTAAECDRLKAANVELVKALGKATEAFDIAISLTPTGPARNRLCDMNIESRAALAKAKEPTP